MSRRMFPVLLSLVVMPGVAVAQGMGGNNQGGPMAAVKPLYDTFKGYLIASAEQMPESDYGFKPTPEVRSFGGIVGHLASANYMFCAAALGEDNPNSQNFEQVSSKAELVQGLKDSFAYCDTAYEMPMRKAMEQVTFFGQQGSRLWVLNFGLTHSAEHYGNFVTYMRLKGMTPPSSQGGGM